MENSGEADADHRGYKDRMVAGQHAPQTKQAVVRHRLLQVKSGFPSVYPALRHKPQIILDFGC